MTPWWRGRWGRRAARLQHLPRDLSVQERMCLPTADRFPSYPDESAAFYRHVMDLAWGVRSPILGVYHAAIAALVTLAIAVLVWIGWQASDRRLPVHDVTAHLLTASVAAGGRVRISFDLVRDRVCSVDITASIIDGKGELRPLVTMHRDVSGPIGPDHFVRSWEVPSESAPGPEARARIGWAYACPGNYLQALSPLPLAFPDMRFTISTD